MAADSSESTGSADSPRPKRPFISARLIILVVVGAAMATYWATREPVVFDPNDAGDRDQIVADDLSAVEVGQQLVWQQPCEGEGPPEDAPVELSIDVWVDPADTKNRLHFSITEAHGYYVDTPSMLFWYQEAGEDIGPEESGLVLRQTMFNNLVPANGEMRDCLEVVAAELELVGGDIGTTENWQAEVIDYHRARIENCDPLPTVTKRVKCD